MDFDVRLNELDIIIPEAAKPVASYVPGMKDGDLIYVSAQLPFKNGELIYTGRLGIDLSIEEGQAAAQVAAINCLAVIKSIINDWNNFINIVKITGFVQSAPDFFQQAQVMNGASDLLVQIFGDNGKHARAAVGVSCLPLNSACAIEMIARVK
jgi:enamine deaminase RidA (YjgF/YER057c/UK114 family)